MLVDDHAPIRQMVRSILDAYEDYQIIGEAADGKEAVEMAAMYKPDVILMDIRMPRMNGFEATNLIKKSSSDTTIIGLCVIQDAYAMEAFMRAGASAVVSKDRLSALHSTILQACKPRLAPFKSFH
jgi:DNA-binding NarL/FixJ family response regulator